MLVLGSVAPSKARSALRCCLFCTGGGGIQHTAAGGGFGKSCLHCSLEMLCFVDRF